MSKFACRRNSSNTLGQYTILLKSKTTPERKKTATLWVPQCPAPERLWEIYRGRGADTMVSSAFKGAHDDLAALSPPQGLTEDLFTAYVAGILRQMPLLTEIRQVGIDRVDGHKSARSFSPIVSVGGTSDTNDYRQMWRIVKQWLVHFFPELYRLETGHEILIKGRELPRR